MGGGAEAHSWVLLKEGEWVGCWIIVDGFELVSIDEDMRDIVALLSEIEIEACGAVAEFRIADSAWISFSFSFVEVPDCGVSCVRCD